jgi:hypothetical protein
LLKQLSVHELRVRGHAHTRQEAPQIASYRGRVIAHLTPGETHYPPSLRKKKPIALPVCLEGSSGAVCRSSIQLAKAVDLEEAIADLKYSIEARPREAMSIKESDKALLELTPGDPPGGIRVEQGAKIRHTATSRIPGDEVR